MWNAAKSLAGLHTGLVKAYSSATGVTALSRRIHVQHACSTREESTTSAGLGTRTPELHINIEEMQHACVQATPTSCITLLQRCQALVAARWQRALSTLPVVLNRVVQHTAEGSEAHHGYQKDAEEVLVAIKQHTKSHTAMNPFSDGQLRLSISEATHLCQDLRQAVDKSEQLQARLLAVVQPIVRSSIARVAQPVDQSPSSPAKATLPHDPLRPIRHTTACMYEGASDSASADSTESVLDSVDEIMKVSEGALLTTRLLLRHMAEVIAFKHEVHVPVHPSVRHLHGSSTMQLKEITPLVERLSPVQLVHGIIDNVKGFAVEKYGLPPDFEVTHSGDMNGIQVVSQPALVEYVLLEVLKNAVTALEAKVGAWDLDEAPPVQIHISLRPSKQSGCTGSGTCTDTTSPPAEQADNVYGLEHHSIDTPRAPEMWDPNQTASGDPDTRLHSDAQQAECSSSTLSTAHNVKLGSYKVYWEVAIKDAAGGMSKHTLQKAQHFFISSVVPREPTYAYSKDHGVTFSGLGVGLPMAALYSEYMGGSLAIEQLEDEHDKGTCVTVRLPVEGFECK